MLPPKIVCKFTFVSKPISKLLFKVKSTLGSELKKKGNDAFFTISFHG